jgi:rubrerythrin
VEAKPAPAPALPPLDEATFQYLLEAAYVLQQQIDAQSAPQAPPIKTPPSSLPASADLIPVELIPVEASDSPGSSVQASSPANANDVLALIADTQSALRTQVHDLSGAGKLIAKRIEQITGAAGVAIAVIRGDHLEFSTATGILSSLAGSSAPVGANLPELLQANSWSSAQNAKSPIVFPIFHEGRTIGLLHLSFPENEMLEDHLVRTCQVMAGLMGEAIGRVSQRELKQTLEAERTTMMQILEHLRPQLERMVSDSAEKSATKAAATTKADLDAPLFSAQIERELQKQLEMVNPAPVPVRTAPATYACQQCGVTLGDDEIFCGKCGAPQLNDVPAPQPGTKETKAVSPPPQPAIPLAPARVIEKPKQTENAVATRVQLPQIPARDVMDRFKPRPRPAQEDAPKPSTAVPVTGAVSDAGLRDGSVLLEPSKAVQRPQPAEAQLVPVAAKPVEQLALIPEEQKAAATEIVPAPQQVPQPNQSPWASASKTHEWLDKVQKASSPSKAWVAKHRADLWVGVSLVLLLLALSGWGSRSTIVGAAQNKVVKPSLTLFERLLVALDLAEPPPAQVYQGNPNVRVWVDLHSALYYCPGADLYGKTAQGKYTTQRDALLDQFEPAARKYCQ